MGQSLFRIFLFVVAAFAVAFAGAPVVAYRSLRAATVAEDAKAVNELVDVYALRKSLVVQLDPDLGQSAEPPTIWQDPIGALRRAWKQVAPSEPKTERYMTLAGLSALARGYDPANAPPEPKPDGTLSGTAKGLVRGPWPGIAYAGVDRVRFAIKRPGQPQAVTVLTFERRALFTWKLTHAQLPDDQRADRKTAP